MHTQNGISLFFTNDESVKILPNKLNIENKKIEK